MIHDYQIDRKKVDRGCSDRTVRDRDSPQGQQVQDLTQAEAGQSSGGCGVMVGYVDDGAYSFAHNNH